MTRPKRSRRGFLPPCPTCGGPKGKRTSAQCHPCHLAAVAAAKAEKPPCPVCGGEKANAKARVCRSCWSAATKASERNAAMCADWSSGQYTKGQLVAKYGITVDRINTILTRGGAVLPDGELRRRLADGGRKGIRTLRAQGRSGRRRVWPDCPEYLQAEYMRLRARGIKAAEARRILEEHEAARGSDIFCK